MAPPGAPSDSSSAGSQEEILKYAPWQSVVKPDFWHGFANLKLDVLRLDQRPLPIQGYFAPCSHAKISQPMQLIQESLSFELRTASSFAGDRNRCPAPGTFYNTNTADEFEALDKEALILAEGGKLWDDICSGRAEEDCKLLNRFFVISYADLKEWRFKHRFGFPTIKLVQPIKYTSLQKAYDYFSPEEHGSIVTACTAWRESPATVCVPFFLLHLTHDSVTARHISDWEKCQGDGKVVLGFYDPSNSTGNPGWPARNLLLLAATRWGVKNTTLLCWREKNGRADLRECLIVSVAIEDFTVSKTTDGAPVVVGWDRSSQVSNLANPMNSERLSVSAADLNLKLMKWRFAPSLDLDLLKKTKCLLLGAGTLGCEVALGLLGWGIRDITFVDYGKVGYSNPVRQSLYGVKDVGRAKAEAAPDALRSKCVDVRANGHQFAIPMVGHIVTADQEKETEENFEKLKSLIDEHDVIFLLTDTRESRWLPTLMCCASNTSKIVINSALGFDSYVVMRHGDGPLRSIQNPRLGCYFCNDVVAPTDSTVNRTLDQQCTVSRPGLAPIAGTLAVEMAVGLLHHPLGIAAPADQPLAVTEQTAQVLGIVPHQLRGFLSHFAQLVVSGLAFDNCTACSSKVVSEFKSRGFSFVLEALNSPNYLEDLTGLTDLVNATKSMSLDWEVSEESEEDVPEIE